jgi:hypothetical protein
VNSTEVDWNAVKRVLARIGEKSGDFLEGNILIGGGAAWFYRSLLEFSRDRDFSAPDFSAEEIGFGFPRTSISSAPRERRFRCDLAFRSRANRLRRGSMAFGSIRRTRDFF